MTWIYGGHLCSGVKAQMPVFSSESDGSYVVFSSRDSFGRSFGRQARVKQVFPLLLEDYDTIISHGPPGSCDAAGAMPMQHKGGYLYYIGWTLRRDVPYFNYLSISRFNGDKLEKLGPILGPDVVDSSFAGTFNVVDFGQRYLGYYLSVDGWAPDEKGGLNPTYCIKIAESTDLLSWSKLNYVAIKRGDNEGGISSFSAIEIEGVLHAWFSVRAAKDFRHSKKGGYRIEHAKSLDGLRWERDNDFGLAPGVFSGCDDMTAYPSVFTREGKVIMIFNGDGFGDNGFYWCYMPLETLTEDL